MAQNDDHDNMVLATLFALTFLSGFVDAVSYLGLGHVFTANMTGNIVVLGFAAAGAAGFSAPACLTSIGGFLAGALVAGRIARRLTAKRRQLILAIGVETLVTAASAAVALAVVTVASGWPRFTVIALLAFGMGWRNATVRQLGVRDLATTVLTMTLTGLAADSSPAGGENPLIRRRAGAVAAMLIGALSGAAGYLHIGAGPTLVADSVAVLAVGGALAVTSRSAQDLAKSSKNSRTP